MQSRKIALVCLVLVAAIATMSGPAFAANGSDSILVKVKPHTDVRALAERHGMVVRRHLRPIHWVELTRRSGGEGASISSSSSLAANVEVDPAVKSVDRADAGERVDWNFIPRDPVFEPRWTYAADGLQVGWHLVRPNFPVAWDLTQGIGVTVAVIDSEFDTNNPDLRDKLAFRYNTASGTAQYHTENVQAQPGNVFHGSHTAGLVGARTDNNEGAAGACFECRVMAIKIGSEASGTFVDASFLGDVAEGVIYATNAGASVINMSLGGPRPHQALFDAVNYALARGVVVVASAGNSQLSNPGVPNYPAAYPGVIGVGATTSADVIAPFSNQGPYVDVSAPGERILSTTNGADPEAGTLEDSVAIAVKSGTSMAAPLVAGLAGLMRSVRPDLSPPEVEGLMRLTARDLGIAGPDLVYGAGRIEAASAVAAARAYVRPVPPSPPPAPPPPPAPQKRKKFKKIPGFVQLDVRMRRGKVVYSGKLSTKPRCRSEREVLLLEKNVRKPLARAKSNRRGVFHFVLRKRPQGKVQVKVRSSQVGAKAICKSSRSRFVRIG